MRGQRLDTPDGPTFHTGAGDNGCPLLSKTAA
jgi:hypothetical protein